MIGDYHIHTYFSTDSKANPEDHIQKAIFEGMKEICFTDHVDLDYAPDKDGNPQFKLDADSYYDTMSALREKYAGKLRIKIGIELGMAPDFLDANKAFANKKPWDYVIGSTHQIEGVDPYYASYWEDKTEKEVILSYYETCLKNINCGHDFDVFGHIDYIRRYVPNKSYVYESKDFYDITEVILKNLISRGKGLELNTRGLHNGVTHFVPTIALFERYKQLGGEIVTIGSDAHDSSALGYSFKIAEDILENVGFKYIASFDGRVPAFVPIR